MSDLDDLSRSVASIRALYGAAACSCALVDEDGAVLRYVAADGEGATAIIGVELPVSRGVAGWAVMSGQPISIRDVSTDPRFARDVAESTNYVPQSMLAAPVFDADGEVLGVVSVLDATVEAASEWTLAVLGTLASQVGMLLTLPRDGTPSADAARDELVARVLHAVDDFRQ